MPFEDARGLDLLAPRPPQIFCGESHVVRSFEDVCPRIFARIAEAASIALRDAAPAGLSKHRTQNSSSESIFEFGGRTVAASGLGRLPLLRRIGQVPRERKSAQFMMPSGQILEILNASKSVDHRDEACIEHNLPSTSGSGSGPTSASPSSALLPPGAGSRATDGTSSHSHKYHWREIAIAPLLVESRPFVLSLFWFVHSSEMLSLLTARTLALRVAQEGPQGADWHAAMRETLQVLLAQSDSMKRVLDTGGIGVGNDHHPDANGRTAHHERPPSALDAIGKGYKDLLQHTSAIAKAETAASSHPGAVASMHDDVLDWVRFVLIRIVLQLFLIVYEGSPSLAEDGPLFPPVLVRRIEAAIDRLTTGPQAGSAAAAKANERFLGNTAVGGAAQSKQSNRSAILIPGASQGSQTGATNSQQGTPTSGTPRVRVAINGKLISNKALWRALSGLSLPKRLSVLYSDDLPELELAAHHGGALYEPSGKAKMPAKATPLIHRRHLLLEQHNLE